MWGLILNYWGYQDEATRPDIQFTEKDLETEKLKLVSIQTNQTPNMGLHTYKLQDRLVEQKLRLKKCPVVGNQDIATWSKIDFKQKSPLVHNSL